MVRDIPQKPQFRTGKSIGIREDKKVSFPGLVFCLKDIYLSGIISVLYESKRRFVVEIRT